MPEDFTDGPDSELDKSPLPSSLDDQFEDDRVREETTGVFDEDSTYVPNPTNEVDTPLFVNEQVFLREETKPEERVDVHDDPEIPIEVRLKAIDFIQKKLEQEHRPLMRYTGYDYFSEVQISSRVNDVMIGTDEDTRKEVIDIFSEVVSFTGSPLLIDTFATDSERVSWEDAVIDAAGTTGDWGTVEAVVQEFQKNKMSPENLVLMNQAMGKGITLFSGDETLVNQMKDIQTKVRYLLNAKNYQEGSDKGKDVQELSNDIDSFLFTNGFINPMKET
ncbi:hypothetical protein KBD68_01100 [Candidatus Woesebacteria bacterium]|nr:hypothetical protein [Candidatus Woesebacteria bacterium]